MTTRRSSTQQKGGNERIRGKRKDIQQRTRPCHLLSGLAERKTTGDTFNLKASCQRNNRDRWWQPERHRARARMADSGSNFLPPCLCLGCGKEQESADGMSRQGREKNMFMRRRLCGDQRLPRVIFESRLRTEFALCNLTENIFAAR